MARRRKERRPKRHWRPGHRARHPAALQALATGSAIGSGMGETPAARTWTTHALITAEGLPGRLLPGSDGAVAEPFGDQTMNRNDAHPIEVLLVACWLALEAAATLVAAMVALLLTLARWRPAASPSRVMAITQTGDLNLSKRVSPVLHPQAELAGGVVDALACCRVSELRQMARAAGLPRTLTRTGRRDALLSALAGLEVATCS